MLTKSLIVSSANGPLRAMLPSSPGTWAVSHLGGGPGPPASARPLLSSEGREHLPTPQLPVLGAVSLPGSSPWPDPRSLSKRGFPFTAAGFGTVGFSQQNFPYTLKQSGVCESCVTKRGKYMGENGNVFVSRQDVGLR